ncbi:hypothetical protein Rhopal_007634-T1 [Rhodotorula paludigena]|uniref:CCR4-NOT transcription complex subunit 11 n=1 Tax=Rhodotorula paludigena TaxID=86838 RepID=A0AAV5GQ84_9BASI|nr:hypothetical protein Rhopal_007634-T1 [Rhodotorula paludigena]
MYELRTAVDKVVAALRQAKESGHQHNHASFACFLHGLFNEHRFFNTYPANELSLAACLFGDLVQSRPINLVPLGIAVRYVLDALRNPPESNLFRFGIQSLARFQGRLGEWPQLAHSIVPIPHVAQLHPDIAATARQALAQRENGSVPGGAELGDLSGAGGALLQQQQQQQQAPQEPERLALTAIHVEEETGDPEAPDEHASDKILFIVNNLAPTNFDSKSLQALKMPPLVKRVLYKTCVKLSTLFNSDKAVQSSTERMLFESLLRQVARVPPSHAWLVAVLRLLVELYQYAKLKLNLKFESEVLCKSLDVDLEDIEPTEILRNRPNELAAQAAAQAAAQGGAAGAPSTSVHLARANFAAQRQQRQQQQQGGALLGPASGAHDVDEHGLRADFGGPNLPSLVVFNAQLPLFASNPALERLICLAIDRAVREIVAPVVERLVTIAGISTRERTMKDSGMEGDESKMATAALLMV